MSKTTIIRSTILSTDDFTLSEGETKTVTYFTGIEIYAKVSKE